MYVCIYIYTFFLLKVEEKTAVAEMHMYIFSNAKINQCVIDIIAWLHVMHLDNAWKDVLKKKNELLNMTNNFHWLKF